MSINASELSAKRKIIHDLVREIEKLAGKCLYSDPLIHAIPNEVYRKCGKSSCKCNSGGENRHGPYKVIQIRVQKGKKQIALRKDQDDIWQKALNYQYQINSLASLRKKCAELAEIVSIVIEKRTEDFNSNEHSK